MKDASHCSLQNAHGHVDAKDSTITSLNHKLNFEKMEAEKFEKRVVELEEKHAKVEQELSATKISLEEKISALSQARKHLKNSRERTLVGVVYLLYLLSFIQQIVFSIS